MAKQSVEEIKHKLALVKKLKKDDSWKYLENVMKEASYNIKTYKNKKEFKSIKELEKELELCIKSENYEQASIIRDEIQNIKNEF